ncbi:MAG TPA: hypothetical protein VJB08_05440 [Candidatus Nanoarchaeia archaeon]|nr:hypothetical protein [Candidatus Nanoarchaeia archaeon]
MKKAQGLPLNAIVIAALVLIVLVVLILIFTGRIGGFSSGTQVAVAESCLARNSQDTANTYTCEVATQCTNEGFTNLGETKDCKLLDKICCRVSRSAE